MIEIKDLNFSYGAKEVLSNITLNMEAGRIYGLLGENGVGKSTLLKLISGLLAPKYGSCSVNGLTPYDRLPSFLSDIYYLPEDFAGGNVKVEDYALRVGGFYPNFSAERFYKIAEEFSVDVKSKFAKLSFGQQKKGIISLALALGTKVLIMDEPTNGLDIPSKVVLRRLIAENASDEQLIIISTHQVRDLDNLIDPIIILDNKETLLNASIQQITHKLSFCLESMRDADAIYSEQTINGYINVRRRMDDDIPETLVDVEVLFNSVLANKTFYKELFS
ncbi:MAG: ATP-binding cassette domain-containing protein [Bacteroidales bacterium]